MVNINEKYELWKNKLLDLGKRNKLLNYGRSARSNVYIEYPECVDLWNMFVRDELTVTFPFENEGVNDTESGIKSNVQTDKTVKELQNTLRTLRSKAQTAIEEQGVNVLYLSFGFLEWTEGNDCYVAPLILVPVTLSVRSIKSPYQLKLHEDEIILNPTLVYKLKNDGIILPSFDENGDIDDFFDEVRKEIALMPNWSVLKNVGLSLLSFLKINMYEDLNTHKETITGNPIVRAIGGDTSVTEVRNIPREISGYDYDENEKPLDVFQIVDADASQQDAILMAKKGVSFVLQGPPGTGKSQTITNIIAECLADGKKILFVSEKMAALDVVHHRIESAGLDDFCLVLHSHKANKKNVLEQLSKVLDLSQKKVTLSDEAHQKLDSLQADKIKLNEYTTQVHTVIEPLGKSIYDANGIVAYLDSYDDFVFEINDVRNTSKEKYNEYIRVLSEFIKTLGEMSDDYKNNPWRDSRLSDFGLQFIQDLNIRMESLLSGIQTLDKGFTEILSKLHLNMPHTMNDLNTAIDLLDSACMAENVVPHEWILSDKIHSLSSLYTEIAECVETKSKLTSLIDEFTNGYKVIRGYDALLPISDVDKLYSQVALEEEKNSILSYMEAQAPYCYWFARPVNEVLNLIKFYLSRAQNEAKRIISLKEELLEKYESTIFELDYEPILARFKTEYTSVTKIFKKTYKQDKKSIILHHRGIVKNISDEEMYDVLEKLKKIDESEKWYNDNSDPLSKLFGEGIIAEKTDYDTLEKQADAYKAVMNIIEIIDRMIDAYKEIDSKEELLQDHYKFLYNGILSDWDMIHRSLDWAVMFKDKVAEAAASEEFIKAVCENEGDNFVNLCRNSLKELKELKKGILGDFIWSVSLFNDPEIFNCMTFDDLYDRFYACVGNDPSVSSDDCVGISALEAWNAHSLARAKCVDIGLGDFIRVLEENEGQHIPVDTILPIFKKRFFLLWLDAVMPEYPAVMNFRRKSYETTVEEFSSLDKVQFEIAKARIKSKLINDLPSVEHFTNGVDEISVLKRELGKQRKIMPIRRLFKEIPNLLLTLKPCLMMSPLSVSLFLEAETYKFDIVIFDEASQVCTENAIGAISRAKQVIITGDSRQLPPTSFFQAVVTEGDFDVDADDDDEDDNYSDDYDSILDEAAVSLPVLTLNWHYRSRHESLIAFSNEHIYDSKLVTFPSNIEKATNVGVEYVHVDGYYNKSKANGKKGNLKEAEKIAELVFEHFRDRPDRSLGIIAFSEEQQQMIETVIRNRRMTDQSMEEFFAEDKEEAFFVKNLENVQGDERDTIIFSIGYAPDQNGVFKMNFGPLSKTGGERRLNVAITRAKYNIKLVGSILPTDIHVGESKNEGPKMLRDYIEFAIGSSVRKNDEQEHIDANASSFEEVVKYEKAVEAFLSDKGYSFATHVGCSNYRIDIAVKHPTISDVYVLGIECDGEAYRSGRTARERNRLRQEVLEKMGWKIYHMWSTDWIKDSVTEGSKLIDAIENAIESYGTTEASCSEGATDVEHDESTADFVNVEEIDPSVQNSENPYGFEEKQQTDFSKLRRNKYGRFEVSDCIMEIVNQEYPIHYELLCQRIASILDTEKAPLKTRREVDYALRQLGNKIVRKDDFIFPAGYQVIPVRMPNDRKIQYIHSEELAEAMYRILQTCVGITREKLIAETARVYGINRVGQNIILPMSEALDILIKANKIEEFGGKIRIKK